MKIEELSATSRGDVLELAELLDMRPDEDISEKNIPLAVMFMELPLWRKEVAWRKIVRDNLNSIRDAVDFSTDLLRPVFISVLTGNIVMIPGAPPCDFTGNPITEAVEPFEAHVINITVLYKRHHEQK